ncbi:CcdB family protein [Jannaschia formosa]|uniref:CcdB family protein n=1 Tax=Jannaschia formosa TaxID=2259592 RepID=UPI00142F6A72|nr:CcdB family protein [Jannaschia formosa]
MDPRQWAVHRLAGDDSLILVIQSDLLGETGSRIVAPLAPEAAVRALDKRLRPVVVVGDEPLVAVLLNLATLYLPEIGPWVMDVPDARDDITRALDMVLGGI